MYSRCKTLVQVQKPRYLMYIIARYFKIVRLDCKISIPRPSAFVQAYIVALLASPGLWVGTQLPVDEFIACDDYLDYVDLLYLP